MVWSVFRVLRLLLAGVLALALLAGCAPARKAAEQAADDKPLAYPAPPDPARFYFERRLESQADIEPVSEQDRLKNLLTGASVGAMAMAKPYAVAVSRGRVYVTDTVQRKIHVFDVPKGRYSEINEVDQGALAKPLGIDVDRQGNVYVADATWKCIFVFGPDGKFVRRLGGTKDFDRISSVTVDPEGKHVYAVDIGGVKSENHRVRVLDAMTGAVVRDIGKRGSGPGEFNLPRDLAIGKDGRLYVVDGGNFRVQAFDADGKYLFAFGKVGRQYGDFSRPKEIATDAEGNVYVADAAFGNFQVFSPEGDLLLFVGDRSEQNRPGRYMLPSGIFVDEDGRVYFVDQWFKKVEVFRPATLPETAGYLVEESRRPKVVK